MAKKTVADFVEEATAKEQSAAAASSVDEAVVGTPAEPQVEAKAETPEPTVVEGPKPKGETHSTNIPEPEAPFDYQKWASEVPPQARTEIERRMQYQLDNYIQTTFGPELSALATEIMRDPSLAKQLGQLTNKEMREFLFEYGVDAYNSMPQPEGTPPREVVELQTKLQQYEARESEQKRQQEWNNYLAYRDNEFSALAREFPEVNDVNFRNFIVQQAHDRTQIQMARGVNAPVAFRDVYLEIKRIQNTQPNAPSIPATSNGGPQAPTDKVDVKNKILKDLKGRSLSEFARLGKTYD